MSLPPAAGRPSLSWYRSLVADPDRAARVGIGIVLTLAMAWSLGARDFGALQAALGLATLLSAASSLGLDPLVRQQLRAQPYDTASTLGTSMALRCSLGLIAYIGMLCFTSRNQATPQSIWLVAALMVLMQTPLLLGLRLEEAGHNDRVRFARNFGFAVSSLLVLAMVWRDADPVWFACAIVLEQPMVALLLLYSHGRIAPEEEAFTWDTKTARHWLARCKSTWAAPLFSLLLVPTSLLVLIGQNTASHAGSFGLALVLFEAGAFCASALLSARRADETTASMQGDPIQENKSSDLFTQSAVIGWLCVVAVAAVSTGFGFTLLRNRVAEFPLVGSLVGISLLPLVLGLARDAQLSVDATKSRRRTQLVTAGMNLVLALILDRHLGATGAAVALLLSVITGELIVPLFVPSERKLARSQGKALILWSRWHGPKMPAPAAVPAMTPDSQTPTAIEVPAPESAMHARVPSTEDNISAVSPAGVVAKSS